MPVRLNSIVSSDKIEKVFFNIVAKDLDKIEDVFVTDDKLKCNCVKYIIDKITGAKIGRIVFTIKTNEKEKCNELLDVDITLLNDNYAELCFECRYEESSDANEYYQVSSSDGFHFEVETVGRYRVPIEILKTKQKVYLSAFPFQLNIYDTIEELNKDMGFEKPIQTPIKELSCSGYAKNFMGSGTMFINSNEISSFIIGTVESFRDVIAIIGDMEVPFTIVNLKTGVGNMPVAVSKDVFELNGISKNKVIMMLCDLKAEFR